MCPSIPSMLWMTLALGLGLGLGRKPEERPEVEEGDRDGAALLVGVLRGLLEVEQPRAGSYRRDINTVISRSDHC